MKLRIKARNPLSGTVQEICEAVDQQWDELESKDWNGSIDSMPDCLKQVKKRKGMQTEF